MRSRSQLIAEVTDNAFLGGKLMLRQPAKGYRAGLDPVLLAACVPAVPGQRVLDLGCGVGTALFCLGARVDGLSLSGLEIQPDYAELARFNAAENGIEAQICAGSVSDLPQELRQKSFDHVIANPPYFEETSVTKAQDSGRHIGRAEHVPLSDWCRAGIKRLAPKGRFSMIMVADRLPEVLDAFNAGLGDVAVKPIASRQGQVARLVLIQGVKNARGPFRLHSPLILHQGDRHIKDGESYRKTVADILRNGAPLSFED
ncbi:tRNA1(Val) (adenine(37)-N6)-methyltransferase [Algirhabdus cladophorae]|uniref:tRNA1(Val) (adenine(37)-N6)-methyltransferase n=1 Tax=Algirhabdus cladophorae TaxID=3377108 RepID=UPI003B84601D